jgi:hypothetical protein
MVSSAVLRRFAERVSALRGTVERSLERAMGIEPTRAALPGLENKRFGVLVIAKCDGCVNFRGM